MTSIPLDPEHARRVAAMNAELDRAGVDPLVDEPPDARIGDEHRVLGLHAIRDRAGARCVLVTASSQEMGTVPTTLTRDQAREAHEWLGRWLASSEPFIELERLATLNADGKLTRGELYERTTHALRGLLGPGLLEEFSETLRRVVAGAVFFGGERGAVAATVAPMSFVVGQFVVLIADLAAAVHITAGTCGIVTAAGPAGTMVHFEREGQRTRVTLQPAEIRPYVAGLCPRCEARQSEPFRFTTCGKCAFQWVDPAYLYAPSESTVSSQYVDSLVILRSSNRDGATYALESRAIARLREAFGSRFRHRPRIFIAHAEGDQDVMRDVVGPVVLLLTGLSERILQEVGGVEFRDPETDHVLPIA